MHKINDILKPKSEEEIFERINRKKLLPDELLYLSSQANYLKGVQLALDRGAIVIKSAAHIASIHNSFEIIVFLFENSLIDEEIKNGMLYCSASNGHLELTKFLIEQGADVKHNCNSALRWASAYGYLDIVKLLLENGADYRDWDDWALRIAIKNGKYDVVELLVNHEKQLKLKSNE